MSVGLGWMSLPFFAAADRAVMCAWAGGWSELSRRLGGAAWANSSINTRPPISLRLPSPIFPCSLSSTFSARSRGFQTGGQLRFLPGRWDRQRGSPIDLQNSAPPFNDAVNSFPETFRSWFPLI
ncbi:hypothetical protein DFJ73DRAFT_871796 [Zopfochytrium polystomum]|nr:hypothetical protein DFJ73DRAFT_871796 [Zopfochytrium polystomum]